jgi:hypothetical protein
MAGHGELARAGGGRGRGGREEVEGDAHPECCRRGGSAPAAAPVALCCYLLFVGKKNTWGRK